MIYVKYTKPVLDPFQFNREIPQDGSLFYNAQAFLYQVHISFERMQGSEIPGNICSTIDRCCFSEFDMSFCCIEM